MASFEKTLAILDLFEERTGVWSLEDIQARLSCSQATAYKHLKALTDRNLLSHYHGRGYALGPRITELDYRIRQHDPLITSADPIMGNLVNQQDAVAHILRLYGNRVICVHQVSGLGPGRTSYDRGQARPLYLGAASLVVLANLPPTRIKQIYSDEKAAFGETALGADLAEILQSLTAIREAGWTHTVGQVTSGVTGIAAPIFDGQAVIGSLNLTLPKDRLAVSKIESLGDKIAFAAACISDSAFERR